jgi:hypothetical protein
VELALDKQVFRSNADFLRKVSRFFLLEGVTAKIVPPKPTTRSEGCPPKNERRKDEKTLHHI